MPDPPPHTLQVADGLVPREQWRDVNDHCAILSALDVISTRTAFIVLREAFYGATRFEEFTQRGEISEPVAAARLKELAEAGLLVRVPYRDPGQRTRHGYELTERGADLFPALLALWDWGARWRHDDGTRIHFTHRDCGAPVRTTVTCDHGHPVDLASTEITLRPR